MRAEEDEEEVDMDRSDKCESAFYIDVVACTDCLNVQIDPDQLDAKALFDAGTVVAIGSDGIATTSG